MQCTEDGCEKRSLRQGLCPEHEQLEGMAATLMGEAVDEAPALQREGADVTTAAQKRNAKHCSALTNAGNPCKGFAIADSDMCAGHSRRGAVANPVASQAKSAQARKRKAAERESRAERALDVQAAGVRGRILARLEERWDAVVRVLVDDAIDKGDRGTLFRALDQALGRPTETVAHEVRRPQFMDELDAMTFEDKLALLNQLQSPPSLQLVKSDAAGA